MLLLSLPWYVEQSFDEFDTKGGKNSAYLSLRNLLPQPANSPINRQETWVDLEAREKSEKPLGGGSVGRENRGYPSDV
jgi:hypothetical protein